jgi:hypothetical protein
MESITFCNVVFDYKLMGTWYGIKWDGTARTGAGLSRPARRFQTPPAGHHWSQKFQLLNGFPFVPPLFHFSFPLFFVYKVTPYPSYTTHIAILP